MKHSIEKRRVATVRAVLDTMAALADDLDTDPKMGIDAAQAQEAVDCLTRLHDSLSTKLRALEAANE